MKNNNNIEEYFVKHVLENFYEDKHYNFEVKDKPDLQDEELSVGIEVTTAMTKEEREINALANKLMYKEDKEDNLRNIDNAISTIQQDGGSLNKINLDNNSIKEMSEGETLNKNEYIASYSFAKFVDFKNIYDSLEKKLKKLNTPNLYKDFKNQYLFIIDQFEPIEKKYLDEIMENFKRLQDSEIEKKFNYIFLYFNGNLLYEFNMIDKTYKTHYVPETIIEEASNFCKWQTSTNIYKRLKEELEKLNSPNHKDFKNQYLFIIDQYKPLEKYLDEIMKNFDRLQDSAIKKFNYIFLYFNDNLLYEFNMIDKTYKTHYVPETIIEEASIFWKINK